MTSTALSLAAIDASWDDPPSGIRARPVRPAPPPLPLHVVALRLVRAEAVAAGARAELAERMAPGERVEAEPGVWVEAVSARVNAAGEVVGSSGVRVMRRKAGR
jgi:hypothetical protein